MEVAEFVIVEMTGERSWKIGKSDLSLTLYDTGQTDEESETILPRCHITVVGISWLRLTTTHALTR
jgi:hypothetical protein